MDRLAAQLSAANPADTITGATLFARMWDAQNPLGTQPATGVAQCSRQINNWPVDCRPIEGLQAGQPLTFMNQYIPISLVNRFDLRDQATFADCGEYRVIFANPISSRNFIIFEAQVPNPTPGVASGCLPIQNLWASLSSNNSDASRAAILENFYFNGIPSANVRAVIDSRNYAQNTGQIRTNQFMTGPWLLKEYKAGIQNGRNTIQVVSVKSNPVGRLFDINNSDPRAVSFRSDFVQNLPSLLDPNLATFFIAVTNDAHNNGESHSQIPGGNNYISTFFPSRGTAFEAAIANRIAQSGSNLSVDQVLNRATAMTCGGCHMPGTFGINAFDAVGPGQSWPESAGFVHVDEFAFNGVFALSQALTDVFLPARQADLAGFLSANTPAISAPVKLLPGITPAPTPVVPSIDAQELQLDSISNTTGGTGSTTVVRSKRSG